MRPVSPFSSRSIARTVGRIACATVIALWLQAAFPKGRLPRAHVCEGDAAYNLMTIYNAEKEYFARNGNYTTDLATLVPVMRSRPADGGVNCQFSYEVRVRGPMPEFTAYAWGAGDALGMKYKVTSEGTSAGQLLIPFPDEVPGAWR